MKIISIDPGKNGAIVLSDYSKGIPNQIESWKMPILKNGKDYDIRGISNLISSIENLSLIVTEDVHSIFGSSAKSNFIFGLGVGIIRALIECSNIPYLLVHPKTWQKEAWQGISKVKDAKKNSQSSVHRLFPHVNLKASSRCTTDHDGIIDAILIGYYAYLKYKK
jgi:hypothetical protein